MFAFKLKLNVTISTRNGPKNKTKRVQYRFSVLTLQGRRRSQVCLSSHSSRIVDSSNPLHTSLSLTGIIHCSRHGTLHVILFFPKTSKPLHNIDFALLVRRTNYRRTLPLLLRQVLSETWEPNVFCYLCVSTTIWIRETLE